MSLSLTWPHALPNALASDDDERNDLSLLELVREAQRGAESAQRTLIISYQRRIAGFIYSIIGRNDAIDDLAQVVFIKMVRGLACLHDPAQFEAWLFRLARNTCLDHFRRQRLRRIFVPFEPEHSDIAEPSGAGNLEEIDALRHALSKLRPIDRTLLALAQERRTHAEMAEVTGTNVVVVKARLHRARTRLRAFYQPSHES